MTVSTVVAGLLPIMWSDRVGADVMKPLAAPVLGGMLSSLAHVLVVTPVLFCWIAERELRPLLVTPEPAATPEASADGGRRGVIGAVAVVLVLLAAATVWQIRGTAPSRETDTPSTVLTSVRAGNLEIRVTSRLGDLHMGDNQFAIEFRDTTSGTPVDVEIGRAHV